MPMFDKEKLLFRCNKCSKEKGVKTEFIGIGDWSKPKVNIDVRSRQNEKN